MSRPDLTIRPARPDEMGELQAIRREAFAPVFESFRSILGEEIYAVAQAREDEGQGEYLSSLIEADTPWELYAVEMDGRLVGFVSVRLDMEAGVGEIGLNAVRPSAAGKGVGTAMYRFALDRMKDAGLRVATVATGGDPSHAPARRAYEKAGFAVGIPSVWLCCDLEKV